MAGEQSPEPFKDDGSLTIVVPSYNEAENLSQVLQEIAAPFSGLSADIEILVVDDGSTDDTIRTLQGLEGRLPVQLRSVRHSANKGLGVALKTGLGAARNAWVGWLPADGQFSPNDLLLLYESRTNTTASVGRVQIAKRRAADSRLRVAMSLTLRMVMRFLHPHIPDFNGIMVFRRDLVNAPNLVCRTGFVNMEILDRIRRTCEGAQISERLVTVLARRSGFSKVANWRTIFIVIADLLRLRLSYTFAGRKQGFKPPKELKCLTSATAASPTS